MDQKILRRVLQIGGMTCTSCEMRIENKLRKLEGISDVKAIYSSSNVYVTYDANIVTLDRIIEEIEKLDYTVKNKSGGQQSGNIKENKESRGIFAKNKEDKYGNKSGQASEGKMPINQLLGIGIIILALYLIAKNTIGFNFIPEVNQNMGYGILFLVGLITSLHCVAMCGGINLSQCVSYRRDTGDAGKLAKVKPSLLYNTGRVISYTILGGIVGALGSVVSFSGTAKGVIAILSGVFMVIMGLNMLNIFPWLRKLNPRMPKIFGNKIHQNGGKYGPFYVGLLNGLMPCGPLQAMQIYALGTGSAFAGALSMLFFSLGTLPLMFGLGALSSLLSGKFTHKMMKVSAVLVMILGIIMLNRGLNLSGFNIGGAVFASSAAAASGNVAQVSGNIQTVTTKLQSNSYTPFIVQKGIPVKWTIKADASSINGCNGTVTIPKYGISQKLVPGDNVIEFTPDAEGNLPYTCWMGMISSNIKVVADVSKVTQSDIDQSQSQGSAPGIGAGGCCGATPPGFADGKIPVDNIQTAKQNGDTQEITVTVDNNGYTPAAFVVQKGVPVVVKFKTGQLNGCNSNVFFPEFNGGMDLAKQTETPALPAEQDFTFQCGMNMLHGYVKVVDNINDFDTASVKKTIEDYKPAGGGGCGM